MGKSCAIRVIAHFCPVLCYVRLRQHISVFIYNIPADYPVRKCVLPLIIRAVYNSLGTNDIKIYHIGH